MERSAGGQDQGHIRGQDQVECLVGDWSMPHKTVKRKILLVCQVKHTDMLTMVRAIFKGVLPNKSLSDIVI